MELEEDCEILNFFSIKKHPVLPQVHHPLTVMFFRKKHVKLLHVGPQHLLSVTREQFWPISAKAVVRNSIRCFRAKPIQITPIMGISISKEWRLLLLFQLMETSAQVLFFSKSSKVKMALLIRVFFQFFFSTKALKHAFLRIPLICRMSPAYWFFGHHITHS